MADRLRRPLPFILVSLRTRWFGVIEDDDDEDGTMGRGEAGKVSGNSNNNDKGVVVSTAGVYFMLGSHLVTMVMHIMALNSSYSEVVVRIH